jgi:membrane protease YdiL (CAAX protease family)
MPPNFPLQKLKSSNFVLIFCLTFPFFLTLNYFVLLAGATPAIQKTAYAIGKIIQFALPVCWVAFVCKEQYCVRRINRSGLAEGCLFGVAAGALILLFYFALSAPGGLFAPDAPVCTAIGSRIRGFGLTETVFLLVGLFYAVIHSGLEEYYWRWFVYKKLSCPIIFAALGFTAHHVIVLGTYFGIASPFCWIASFGVFIGGLYWCWLYRRSDSIWGAWIGHGFVDAAIFAAGYFIITSR